MGTKTAGPPRWVTLECGCGRALGKWQWAGKRDGGYLWAPESVPHWSAVEVVGIDEDAEQVWFVWCDECDHHAEVDDDRVEELLSLVRSEPMGGRISLEWLTVSDDEFWDGPAPWAR